MKDPSLHTGSNDSLHQILMNIDYHRLAKLSQSLVPYTRIKIRNSHVTQLQKKYVNTLRNAIIQHKRRCADSHFRKAKLYKEKLGARARVNAETQPRE